MHRLDRYIGLILISMLSTVSISVYNEVKKIYIYNIYIHLKKKYVFLNSLSVGQTRTILAG